MEAVVQKFKFFCNIFTRLPIHILINLNPYIYEKDTFHAMPVHPGTIKLFTNRQL